jgi:hypothetical protein
MWRLEDERNLFGGRMLKGESRIGLMSVMNGW